METIQKRGLMNILIHPNYFPNIHQFKKIIKASNILFEVSDNYQKQTFRNRTYIYGANGKLGLFIPVIHTHNNRELFRDIKISYDSDWMALHLKSLQSAIEALLILNILKMILSLYILKKKNFLLILTLNVCN